MIELIVTIIALVFGAAGAIFSYRSWRGDVTSRKTHLEQKTIRLRVPKDADDLAKCVAALKGGSLALEPFIPRAEISQLLESREFPTRIVLVGLPGVGK